MFSNEYYKSKKEKEGKKEREKGHREKDTGYPHSSSITHIKDRKQLYCSN